MTMEELAMHPFWRELEEVIRPQFQGRIVLHCQRGAVKRYEIQHAPRRPRQGHVDLEETNLTESAD